MDLDLGAFGESLRAGGDDHEPVGDGDRREDRRSRDRQGPHSPLRNLNPVWNTAWQKDCIAWTDFEFLFANDA